MKTSPLLFLLLITVFVLALTHYLALELYLYWQYTWLDMPMHVLGGVAIAFSVLVLPSLGVRIRNRYLTFIPVIATVLIFGLLWEIFEIWLEIPLFDNNFEKDMVKDLIMDIFGGGIGYLVGSSLRNLEHV